MRRPAITAYQASKAAEPEPEDHFDPDFDIDNDVVVQNPEGTFESYGFPESLVPQGQQRIRAPWTYNVTLRAPAVACGPATSPVSATPSGRSWPTRTV